MAYFLVCVNFSNVFKVKPCSKAFAVPSAARVAAIEVVFIFSLLSSKINWIFIFINYIKKGFQIPF